MGVQWAPSALKGSKQIKCAKKQKRSNIEFNENLSEVWRFNTRPQVLFAFHIFCQEEAG